MGADEWEQLTARGMSQMSSCPLFTRKGSTTATTTKEVTWTTTSSLQRLVGNTIRPPRTLRSRILSHTRLPGYTSQRRGRLQSPSSTLARPRSNLFRSRRRTGRSQAS